MYYMASFIKIFYYLFCEFHMLSSSLYMLNIIYSKRHKSYIHNRLYIYVYIQKIGKMYSYNWYFVPAKFAKVPLTASDDDFSVKNAPRFISLCVIFCLFYTQKVFIAYVRWALYEAKPNTKLHLFVCYSISMKRK